MTDQPVHNIGGPIAPDPDLDAPELDAGTAGAPNLLDELEAELAAPPEPTVITLDVPKRPRWSLRFRCSIDYEGQLQKWQKACTSVKSGPTGKREVLDELRFAGMILGHTCTGVLRDGVELLADRAGQIVAADGFPVTLRTPGFQAMIRCPFDGPDKGKPAFSARTAAQWFYANDGQFAKAADRVVEEAGYGPGAVAPTDVDDVERPDPTGG